jgi:hypothetical protein
VVGYVSPDILKFTFLDTFYNALLQEFHLSDDMVLNNAKGRRLYWLAPELMQEDRLAVCEMTL